NRGPGRAPARPRSPRPCRSHGRAAATARRITAEVVPARDTYFPRRARGGQGNKTRGRDRTPLGRRCGRLYAFSFPRCSTRLPLPPPARGPGRDAPAPRRAAAVACPGRSDYDNLARVFPRPRSFGHAGHLSLLPDRRRGAVGTDAAVLLPGVPAAP